LDSNFFRMDSGVQVIDGDKNRGGAAADKSFSTYMRSFDQRLGDMERSHDEKNATSAAMFANMERRLDEKNATSAAMFANMERRLDEKNATSAAMFADMARLNEKNARLDEKNAHLDEKNATYAAMLADMERRVSETVTVYNELQDILYNHQVTINEQQVNITDLLQRNEDLTIDQGLIDELSRYRDQELIDEVSRHRDRALINELSIYREWAMCPNCDQRQRRDVMCFPCRHTFCTECSTHSDHCPICMEDIERRHRLL
jgi:chromosome segregation ATPase